MGDFVIRECAPSMANLISKLRTRKWPRPGIVYDECVTVSGKQGGSFTGCVVTLHGGVTSYFEHCFVRVMLREYRASFDTFHTFKNCFMTGELGLNSARVCIDCNVSTGTGLNFTVVSPEMRNISVVSTGWIDTKVNGRYGISDLKDILTFFRGRKITLHNFDPDFYHNITLENDTYDIDTYVQNIIRISQPVTNDDFGYPDDDGPDDDD